MAAITTRETGTTGVGGVTRKNLPLTNGEIDTNFINLNTDIASKVDAASFTGTTSIVTLGTVATGTWNATTIATNKGGTGLTSFTSGGAVYATSSSALTTGTLPIASGGTGITSTPSSGSLLIGTSAGGYSSATLTGTTNRITVTNSSGGITLSVPQDIATSSNVQFASLGVGTAASGTSGRIDSTSIVVSSGIQTASLGVGTAASGTTGEIRATNQITSYYSDERLKEDIQEISGALEKVILLRGVTYKPNAIAEKLGYKKQNEVGVIAQDVEKVLPEAVKPAPFDIMLFEDTEISRSGQHYKTVQYEKLVPLLIEAIKELNKEVQQLKGNNQLLSPD
jgi:trimeric autotransporter adhesin